MAARCHFVEKNKSKLGIDLKKREMRLKLIFGHPKWPPAAISLNKFKKKSSVLICNGEKCDWSDFQSSKMAASGHFVKKKSKKKKSCVLICNGEKCDWKWFSVIQNGRQRPFCEKNSKKRKVAYWFAMVRNAIKSNFQSSKMSARGHFVKKKLGIDLKWREMWSKVIFGHPKWFF